MAIDRRQKFCFILAILLVISFVYFLHHFSLRDKIMRRLRPASPQESIEIIKYFSFSDQNCLKEWKEKTLKGRVRYSIQKTGEECCLDAASEKTASALFYKTRLIINRSPLISWKWKISELPAKTSEDLGDKKTDDFAARVYVIFPAKFFLNTKSIEYIWANGLKEGDMARSPYTKNIVLFVVRSGDIKDEWFLEQRDIYRDYKMAFGEEPRMDVGAIAVMTDSDTTKTRAQAQYDEIKIGYRKEKEK